jgi:opacity protein-like surface antigen
MKKVLAILLVLLCAAGLSFADETLAFTPYVDKGELLANVGIGWGGISGGIEFTLARIDIGGIIPLTFGAAGRVAIDPGLFTPDWTSFGVGGFGTAHVGFKEVNLPDGLTWISDFDAYLGIGLGFASGTTSISYYEPKPGIGISTFSGASYYLNDNLAINFEYGYIGRIKYDWDIYTTEYSYPLWYSVLGVVLKL